MKIGLVALGAFAFATAASANAGDNPFAHDTATVQLAGLDLATVDGQRRLAIRMQNAARAVCGDRLAGIHLALEQRARECRAAVSADIRTRIEARMADASGTVPTRLASAR